MVVTGGMPEMVFEYILKENGIDPEKDLTIIQNIDFGSTAPAFAGCPTAAPAGETCLKDVAAGRPVAFLSSLTSCHPLKASRKLIYPALPLSTFIGSSPSFINILAGF